MSAPADTTIRIALSSDNRYATFLATTIASVLANAAPQERLVFYVLDGGITQKNKDKIARMKSWRDFELNFLPVDQKLFEECPPLEGCPHTTVATYYRFLLAEMLPEVDRLIYLDCDIIVRKPLGEFWRTDIDELLAAVVDNAGGQHVMEHKQKIGHKPDELYFNAGVLLLNLKKLREEFPAKVLFEKRRQLNDMGVFDYGDQDTLNYTFKNRVREMDRIYNFQEGFFQTIDQEDKKVCDEIRQTTVIAHFTSGKKPDKLGCSHLLKDEWFRYLKLSGFRTWRHWVFEKLKNTPPYIWFFKHTNSEVLLFIFKLCIFKITLITPKGEFKLKLLGLPFLEAYRKDNKLHLKALWVPLA